MYYEEKIINGLLCYRTTPDGKWEPCPLHIVTTKLKETEEKLKETEKQRAKLVNKIVELEKS